MSSSPTAGVVAPTRPGPILIGIGHAIARAEIPAALAGYPVLGHEATTIALATSESEALILTRDRIKTAWLVENCQAVATGEIRSRHPRLAALSRLPIFSLTMPRLVELDAANHRAAQDIVHAFSDASTQAWRAHRSLGDQRRALVRHFLDRPGHALHPLATFLRRYRWNQYDYDLRVDNFLQSRAGTLVMLDPVIGSRIQTILERHHPAA